MGLWEVHALTPGRVTKVFSVLRVNPELSSHKLFFTWKIYCCLKYAIFWVCLRVAYFTRYTTCVTLSMCKCQQEFYKSKFCYWVSLMPVNDFFGEKYINIIKNISLMHTNNDNKLKVLHISVVLLQTHITHWQNIASVQNN